MKLLQRLKNLFLPEGEVSDGFHTFDELYHYRMLYNAAFLKDGKLMNGMAILQLRLQTDYTGSLYIMALLVGQLIEILQRYDRDREVMIHTLKGETVDVNGFYLTNLDVIPSD